MQLHIDTAQDDRRERVLQLTRYSLNGHREDILSLQLKLDSLPDALGTRLHRCQLHALARQGPPIKVEEVQSRLDLAVTRALDRCVRTIRRRRASRRHHST